MAFSLLVDVAEPRIARDRIVCLTDGRHWDDIKTTGYVDGITQTGMLTPLPRTPEWETTTSGSYARLGKKDYTFDIPPFVPEETAPPYPAGAAGHPDQWVEFNYFAGDIFMQANGVNERAITNAKYPKNRSFHLGWFAYNEGKTSQVQIECGWLSDSAFIGLRFWTDGKVEIFKNGIQVGQGNAFERKVTSQTVYGKERQSVNTRPRARKGDSKQLAQQLVEVLLIPCRRRDLLIQSNQGGGFKFTFEDLDPDNPDNTITPGNAQFFWRVPTGQATVQCAPLMFKTSGYLLSDIIALDTAPGGTIAPAETPTLAAFVDNPGYGTGGYTVSLMETDGVTPFAKDGNKNQVRLKVALTGDGTSSNWVYGAEAVYDAVTADTDGSTASDIRPYVQQASLSVPENSADVLFKVTCNAPAAMEAGGAYLISTQENKPVECQFDGISFLSGRGKPPVLKKGNTDENSHLMLEFRDRCKSLEEYRFKRATPYDGLEVAEAMRQIITLTGYSRDDLDIPDIGFNLPTIGQGSEGEFALYPEVGDKALDWFTRIWQTYARCWEWGWVPLASGPVFQVIHLDELNAQSPVYTLYPTIEDAVNIGGVSQSEAYQFVYRTSDPTPIPCEANQIYVTGIDSRTAKVFRTVFTDTRSIDPTIPAIERPDNWVGEPRVYSWGDPSIGDFEDASWVSATLQRRLTQPRDIHPFTSEFLITDDGSPVWKGDIVTLYGIGNVRITTLSAQFTQTNEAIKWNPTSYTSELVRYPTF